jgi:hypothetical protein
MRVWPALTSSVLALQALAQSAAAPEQIWGTADYDPQVPSPASVIGHRIGERLTVSADIRRYFEALQQSAPDRMVMGEYGRTWEGRPLVWAAISSARNITRLDAIRAASRSLADPRRTDAAQAESLIAEQPVIVWLAYSVHGDEVSPAEASMAVARHLLASRDGAIAKLLEQAVIVMVPAQNPDGRDRFISFHETARGLEVDEDPLAAEKSARSLWPRGRYNHYLFDLNRDWVTLTQPENRGHSRLLLEWRPQVLVDAHEMGDTDSTFFFSPEAEPINPLLPQAQLKSRSIFGRAHARVFDREGIDYFTREVYDAFYPGYVDSWPAYLGVVSMTYEQASARGLAGRRRAGPALTLFETVRNHAFASLSTIETAVAHRERLLSDFFAYHETALEEGRSKGIWILPVSEEDPGAGARLANLLARHSLEVDRADAPFKACGQNYEAGTHLVDMAQPHGRLAQVILDPDIRMREGFVAEQERRRTKRLPVETYDVTAWSLPEAFNTPAVLCRRVSVDRTRIAPDAPSQPQVSGVGDPVAYVVPAGSQAMRFLAMALREGLAVRSADAAFTLGGRSYRSGSLILTRAANPQNLAERVAALSTASGAAVEGVADSWVTEGPSFGSERTPLFFAPRIALAWDEPTRATSAGPVRYLIEREYSYPVTAIRMTDLASADIARYDVLILPDGDDFADALGQDGLASLRTWVHRGGVLVGIGGAVEMMADPESEMLEARKERLADPDDLSAKDEKKDEAESDEEDSESSAETDEDDGTVAGTVLRNEKVYKAALRPEKIAPDDVPGAYARAVVDPDHWMGAGAAPTVNVMVTGTTIFEPLKLDSGVNVARFAAPEELSVAGYLWEENRKQLAFKPFLMVQPEENGYYIAFTQDPAARGYMRGLDVLFLNALFRAPAHASRVR